MIDIIGSGIVIIIFLFFFESLIGELIENLFLDLLKKLINEFNFFGVEYILINEWRVVNYIVIRDINGIMKIDGYGFDDYFLIVKVFVKDLDMLYSRVKGLGFEDFFVFENLVLKVGKFDSNLILKVYDRLLDV